MSTIVLRFTLALIVLIASPLDSIADGLRATVADQPVASAAHTATISAQPRPVEQTPTARPATLCADVVPPTGIDMVDIMSIAARWGQHSGDPGWDARFDLDGDNAITVNDLTLAASAWQTTCLPPDPIAVAPPLDPSVTNDFGDSVSFLYSGSNPIQTGVVLYDALGRRAVEQQGDQSLAFTYDAGNRVTTITDAAGRQRHFSYDAVGRVASITMPGGRVTSFGYTYSARLLTGMAWTGAAQGQFSYTFDNNFDVTALNLTSSPNSYSLPITRDDDGQITQFGPFSVQRNGPGGRASRIGDATLRTDFSYDALGRVTGKTAAANGSPFYDLQVAYDTIGRITQKVETVAGVPHTTVYTYDLDDQLTSVTRDSVVIEQYTYDANGNRLTRQLGANPVETSTYDVQDRLQQRDAVVYTFDADGFLAQRNSDTFQYSAKGELLQAVVGGVTVTYAYDGLGRRVSRTSGASTYQYLYGDPGNAFLVTAVRNPANQLTIYHYDEAGQLVAMEWAGVRYLIAADQVGTPRVVRNAAGSVVKVVEYDSFGNLVSDSNPSFELPFGFAGGLADATTGLVRFGFRDYDPAAGRWTAKDPVLFDGGQGNLYVYVGSNPISLRDPLGLWCFGGSFYATLGGGAQYCLDREKGFSLCVEAGLGVGGDVNLSGGSIPDADEIGFEFNPTCFGVGGTLACGFKICNGTATWQCSTEGEAGPDFEQVKFNGESTGVKFNVGAPDLEFGRCKVQAKLYAKKCFVKRF